jgi:magnesium transporter
LADVSNPDTTVPTPGPDDGTPDALIADLESGIEEQVVSALDEGDLDAVRALTAELHYTDIADLIERVDDDNRAHLIEVIRDEFDAEILPDLDDAIRDEVIDLLGIDGVAAAMVELETDDAVEVLEELDEDDQKRVLDAIPEGDRAILEEGLSYPDDSAGRLMQRELVTVPTFWTIGDTIDFMRRNADSEDNGLPEQFYVIYVVDPLHRPVGKVALDKVLTSRRPVKLEDVMETELKIVPATADQEDVAFLFRQRDLVSAPVVDESGRLVGAITIDDIVDVIDEEHEEDIMRMGGVREHDLYDAVIDTARSRFSWLVINLLTAIVASIVIGLFDATIEEIVALAVLMPIVASMGGNAGTQTLTVAVRSIAMKELTATNAPRLIGKELMVGVFNGLIFAVLAGVVAWVWFSNPMLGVVIGLAMIVNMIVAGVAGTAIPIVLDRMDVDPAVASGVFLTTITDVVGFFVFLGLAALILL